MWWSKLCGCLALIRVLAGCRVLPFIRGPKEGEVAQWDTLRSSFITDVDKTNLLRECWDMIFNENLIIINMLLLNILCGKIIISQLMVDSMGSLSWFASKSLTWPVFLVWPEIGYWWVWQRLTGLICPVTCVLFTADPDYPELWHH